MKKYIESGVHFGDIHSFRDLNLVLAPFDYTPAVPKTKFIEIPGGDGTIDATEADGTIHYQDREFQFIFTVMPGDTLTFEERQTAVAKALNGKRFDKIVLDKDPEYFWRGRVWIDEYASNKRLRQIAVVARVSPYKVKLQKTYQEFDLLPEYLPFDIVVENGGCKTIIPQIHLIEGEVGARIYRTEWLKPVGEPTYLVQNGIITCDKLPLYPGNNTFLVENATHFIFISQEEDL